MKSLTFCLIISICALTSSMSYAEGCFPSLPSVKIPSCETDGCCHGMGGVSYCDSSAGRLVCQNGYYSSCYCTRRAVMDLQAVQGCCLWQGGVLAVTPERLVLCNDGGYSEVCTIQHAKQRFGVY